MIRFVLRAPLGAAMIIGKDDIYTGLSKSFAIQKNK